MEACYTCELLAQRDTGSRPLWDAIYRTPCWDVVHSYNTALPGWLVIIARRHITAIDELTEPEAVELGSLLRRISIALKEVTGCAKTYVAQFAEAAGHPHVHFHMMPRMVDQPADHRGPLIFQYLGVPDDSRVSEPDMNAIASQLQTILARFSD